MNLLTGSTPTTSAAGGAIRTASGGKTRAVASPAARGAGEGAAASVAIVLNFTYSNFLIN